MAALVHTHSRFSVSFASAIQAAFFPVSERAIPRPSQRLPILERLRQRLHLKAVLPAVLVPIPSLVDTLWDGILNAVPKKKTSHMKKRHRQMAGKALKDVTALTKCSACGRIKRAHILCPYCVQSIKQWLGNGFKTKEQVATQKRLDAEEMNAQLEAIGKKPYSIPDATTKDASRHI